MVMTGRGQARCSRRWRLREEMSDGQWLSNCQKVSEMLLTASVIRQRRNALLQNN